MPQITFPATNRETTSTTPSLTNTVRYPSKAARDAASFDHLAWYLRTI